MPDMPVDTLIRALRLPAAALVDQRIPKRLLVEQGAPTAADKRLINDAVDGLMWHAALKPATIGVPAWRGVDPGAGGDVIELAVVSAVLRPEVRAAQAQRLQQLVHRAIPYPVLLATQNAAGVGVSLAHKRASLAEAGKMVVQAQHDSGSFDPVAPRPVEQDFLDSLGVDRQPRTDLAALYQGWIDCITALQVARITGRYLPPTSPAVAQAQRDILADLLRLIEDIATLRSQATKERQLNRRAELNLHLQRLQTELKRAEARLTP